VRVAAIPAGQDPADVFRDDPELLAKAVDDPPRLLQSKIDRILASADRTSPEGRARAAEALVPVLREHPNELVREQYIQSAADLGVDHAWFKDQIARRAPGGDAPGPPVTRPQRERPVDPRELDALRWAIHEPAQVAGWLDAALFADPVAREVFDLLATSATFDDALARAEGAARQVLERLAVEEPDAEGDDATIHAKLLVSLAEPAGRRLQRRLEAADDDRVVAVTVELDRLKNARIAGEWNVGEQAASQLVRWAVEWS
jgi:DNA primase